VYEYLRSQINKEKKMEMFVLNFIAGIVGFLMYLGLVAMRVRGKNLVWLLLLVIGGLIIPKAMIGLICSLIGVVLVTIITSQKFV